MTNAEIYEWLNSNGWADHGLWVSQPAYRLFSKRFPRVAPQARPFSDKPGICITLQICNQFSEPSCEIELYGESSDGPVFKILAYSVRLHELKGVLDSTCGRLIRAWVSINAFNSKTECDQ